MTNGWYYGSNGSPRSSISQIKNKPQTKIPTIWGWQDRKTRDLGLSDIGSALIQLFIWSSGQIWKFEPNIHAHIWGKCEPRGVSLWVWCKFFVIFLHWLFVYARITRLSTYTYAYIICFLHRRVLLAALLTIPLIHYHLKIIRSG